jgi:beta-lactamase superfamily II metal-dependent hydrolase
MERLIAVDLADVKDAATGRYVTTLAWGDRVEVTAETEEHVEVTLTRSVVQPDGSHVPVELHGRIRAGRGVVVKPPDELRIFHADFVDVQQGDGAVLQTPGGRVVLLDGGDNVLFARYLASRFRGTSAEHPLPVDAIVVSHGDADHFAGLSLLGDAEQNPNPSKRIFVQPARVFHNGLVKRPSDRRDTEMLGATVDGGERPLIVGLEDDLLAVPDSEMNKDFKKWKHTLEHWATRAPIEIRHLSRGDDDAFDFLASEGVSVQVLGPIPVTHDGRTGLPFLGEPRRRFGHPSAHPTTFGAASASHTINGHSIVLRIRFGSWTLLFAGDLNEQAEQTLVDAHAERELDLRSEVLKVPHHGSADFLHAFLAAVEPVVSVVSCGDESSRKEYIHPRATLLAGLGRHSRSDEPVVFVTELVAFFQAEGWVVPASAQHAGDDVRSGRRGPFFGFSREAFGIVRVRTDGRRLLVCTDSGRAGMKEAYVYTLDADGTAVPQEPIRA